MLALIQEAVNQGPTLPYWTTSVLLGFLGGLVRVLLAREFVWPQRTTNDEGKTAYDFGSLAVILVGGAAGFVAWALTVDELFAGAGFGPKTIAATILAGLGGADALTNYVNQTYGTSVTQETSSTVESQAKSMQIVSEELERSKEEISELKEENARLRNDRQEKQT